MLLSWRGVEGQVIDYRVHLRCLYGLMRECLNLYPYTWGYAIPGRSEETTLSHLYLLPPLWV